MPFSCDSSAFKMTTISSNLASLPLLHCGLLCLMFAFSLNVVESRLDEKTLKDVEKILTDHGIMKEIVDTPPEYLIDLAYDNNKYPIKIGDKIDINKVYQKPSKVSWEAEDGEWFTLLLIDYDAPERRRPELRSFIHWLIGDIPGISMTAGKTFYDYYGLKLFEHKDEHRYVWLLFKQNGKIENWREPIISNTTKSWFPEWVNSKHDQMTDAMRGHLDLKDFQKKYEFGPPYAMTFFTSELNKTAS